ncbi:MAG: serine protease [Actinomycetota bacterium]|nr:serine protease [Actinomycetota bacterium]
MNLRAGKTGMALAAMLAALILAFVGGAPASASGGATVSIIGGKDTSIDRWPWQVAVGYSQARYPRKSPRKRAFCGGSLISPNVVVTAAHCAALIDNSKPSYFVVTTGRTDLENGTAGAEIAVREIYLPRTRSGIPRYIVGDLTWDVALLELEHAATGQPVKIAGPDEAALWAPGQPVWETGWGITDPDRWALPSVLRVSRSTVQTNRLCQYALLWSFYSFDPDSQICLGDARTRAATCAGDSGGPAVVSGSGGYRLIGATSFGTANCDPGEPSIDANLAAPDVRDWIRSNVQAIDGSDPVGSGSTAAAPPPHCLVPDLRGRTLGKARKLIRKAGCQVGKVRHVRLPSARRYRKWNGKVPSRNRDVWWIKSVTHRVEIEIGRWAPRKKRAKAPRTPVRPTGA